MNAVGWLIETKDRVGRPRWWGDLDADGLCTWTYDAWKAIRFCRKEDAEKAINAAEWCDVMREECFATEHAWVDSASLRRGGRMSQWQPIETAPKDGTELLAYWSGGKTYSIVLWSVTDGFWMEEFDRAMVSEPTHWMPLPAPPATPDEGRDG